MAGPLVAAGVLLDLEQIGRSERRALARLDDSKVKSEEEREELYPAVIRAAACVSVAVRSVRFIDTRGLHVSNMDALADCMRAVAPESGAACLVDGFKLHGCEVQHHRVVGGDGRSAAIAAASVIAKVTRDRYMRRAAEFHDLWNFDGNVGYSTPEHRDAIRTHGISPLHRRSFASIAYTQLALGDDERPISPKAGLGRRIGRSCPCGSRCNPARPEAKPRTCRLMAKPSTKTRNGPLERIADVVDINTGLPVADADDVEAVAGDA